MYISVLWVANYQMLRTTALVNMFFLIKNLCFHTNLSWIWYFFYLLKEIWQNNWKTFFLTRIHIFSLMSSQLETLESVPPHSIFLLKRCQRISTSGWLARVTELQIRKNLQVLESIMMIIKKIFFCSTKSKLIRSTLVIVTFAVLKRCLNII